MIKKILRSYDWSLLAVYLALAVFGLIMVYSASMVTAIQVYKLESSRYFFDKQLVNLILSLILLTVTALIPYHLYKIKGFLVVLVLGTIGMLFSLFFIGRSANNATSWLTFFGFNFQPSELAKVAIIISGRCLLEKTIIHKQFQHGCDSADFDFNHYLHAHGFTARYWYGVYHFLHRCCRHYLFGDQSENAIPPHFRWHHVFSNSFAVYLFIQRCYIHRK